MNIPAEFDEIRPYTPEELPQIFDELLADPAFQAVISLIMPGMPLDMLSHKLHQCKNNLEVQKPYSIRCCTKSSKNTATASH